MRDLSLAHCFESRGLLPPCMVQLGELFVRQDGHASAPGMCNISAQMNVVLFPAQLLRASCDFLLLNSFPLVADNLVCAFSCLAAFFRWTAL